MCGIAGFITTAAGHSAASMEEALSRMRDTMAHRGPDDAGAWVDEASGVALGHRRLSIIDLTPDGHQPMSSSGGRFVIVFNGEIYNYRELRGQLEAAGRRLRGSSDTAVMLEAFEQWGIPGSLEKFNGMFAFAVWDRQERELWLARDRFGEKPLHWARANGVFLFASELKALLAHPALEPAVSHDSLALYLRYNYVPCPYTIYSGVWKLPPGAWLRVRMGDAATAGPVPYWSAREAATRGLANPWEGGREEAAEELDGRLREAVRLRMVSDVPLGAFLSGGVDSSAVVALMQRESPQPVRTFTVGFEDDPRHPGFSEARQAAVVAAHLGTDHHELLLTPDEAEKAIGRLAAVYDEPFGDSSQIPTLLISQFARTQVTVALSGDGGDEVFGGYTRYFLGRKLWGRMSRAPASLRKLAAGVLLAIHSETLGKALSACGLRFEDYGRPGGVGDKAHKLAEVLPAGSPAEMYRILVSQWQRPDMAAPGAREPTGTTYALAEALDAPIASRMMLADALGYLPDDILVKLDRASMAVSLEARAPFLDHTLFEFAWRLPEGLKLAGGQGKAVLRDMLYRHVPRDLIERPKMGFGIPVGQWLRGRLRDWAEDLLSEQRLRRDGYLDAAEVRRALSEHLSGRRDRAYQIWGVLMFQAWLDERSGRR